MIRFRSSTTGFQSDSGILLEVWPSGGLLHIEEAMPPGTTIQLLVGERQPAATVRNTEHDEFGYYVEFNTEKPWFPAAYRPECTMAPPRFAEAA